MLTRHAVVLTATIKKIYEVELQREQGDWVIHHMRIDNVWMTGNPTVLFPARET